MVGTSLNWRWRNSGHGGSWKMFNYVFIHISLSCPSFLIVRYSTQWNCASLPCIFTQRKYCIFSIRRVTRGFICPLETPVGTILFLLKDILHMTSPPSGDYFARRNKRFDWLNRFQPTGGEHSPLHFLEMFLASLIQKSFRICGSADDHFRTAFEDFPLLGSFCNPRFIHHPDQDLA